MGMFNTIEITCPSCGGIVEYQSKGGSCQMETLAKEAVTLCELADIADEVETCVHCGASVVVRVDVSVRVALHESGSTMTG